VPPQKNHLVDLFTTLAPKTTFLFFSRASKISRNVTIRGRGEKSAVPGAAPRCPD
jgi:hypothetical protein